MQEKSTTKVVFSRRLISLMSTRNVTQDQLADAIGVTQTTVWKWRKGAIPDGVSTVKLAQFFKVPEESLFMESPDSDTPEGVFVKRSNFYTCRTFPPSKKLKISGLREEIEVLKGAVAEMGRLAERLEKQLAELDGE